MKRKYYMRGMGIGVLVTAILCAVALPSREEPMTDEQIITRAKELGYVKDEGGVTADDINKIKENGQMTGTPAATTAPEATPEGTPGPTISPVPTPEAPNPPNEPEAPEQPTTPTPKEEQPTATATPKPTATKAPTATMVPTKAPTAKPTATKVPDATSYTITVERGMTARRVAERLESAGVIRDANDFVEYLVSAKLTDLINIGTFTIPQEAGYEEIGKILTE